MSEASPISRPEDIPPALAAVLTEFERALLALLLDPEADGDDVARRLVEDALSD
jgi:hypothetical protein